MKAYSSNHVNPANSGDVPQTANNRSTMNGKPILYRTNTRSVLNRKSFEFQHKRLCDCITFNMGDSCVYSCSFCYVEATPISWVNKALIREFNIQMGLGYADPSAAYEKKNPKTGKMVKIIPTTPYPGKKLLGFQDVVIRRSNAIEVLKSELLTPSGKPRYKTAGDTRIVYSSTLVDVAANMDLAKETAEACCLILEHTNWQIRLLSKSHLLPKVAELIPAEFYPRLIMGVSTGTLDDTLAKSFEMGTALPSKRISSLKKIRALGIRTFGMICPSLPQKDYDAFSNDVCTAIDVNACEEVWAEVINLRGKSFSNTINALLASGHTEEANELAKVCGPKTQSQWEAYARETFEAHVRHVPKGKLRFLQYVDAKTYQWWKNREKDGAILLGKYVESLAKKKDASDSSPVMEATELQSGTAKNGVEKHEARGLKSVGFVLKEGDILTAAFVKQPTGESILAFNLSRTKGQGELKRTGNTWELVNPAASNETSASSTPLKPAQKAWETMRQRYTPDELKARHKAAGKKAAETRRLKRLQ